MPLNIRVAEIKDCLFFVWACLAVFRLFRRSCAADAEAIAFGESLEMRPIRCQLSKISKLSSCLPFAAFLSECFVACLDLNFLFC